MLSYIGGCRDRCADILSPLKDGVFVKPWLQPMKIILTMISLNNIATIKPCLDSLVGWTDGVVVVDGGSDDGTECVLAGYKALLPLEVYKHPWPSHFGRQRQWSFKHAPVGKDIWLLRLDTDEVVPPIFRDNIRRLLEGLPPQIMSARIKQYNLVEDGEHYSAALGGWETYPRIWRASHKLHWVGQVHEYVKIRVGKVLEDIPEERVADLNISILHTGWLFEELLRRKERQYMGMEGSGFTEEGSLTGRTHVVREMPWVLEAG